MKYINEFMLVVGWVLCLILVAVIFAGIFKAASQGMDVGSLLNYCELKHERPCEIVAIPKGE